MPESSRPVRADLAAVVVDLNRMGGLEAAGVLRGHPPPFGMGEGDKSTRLASTHRKLWASLHTLDRQKPWGV